MTRPLATHGIPAVDKTPVIVYLANEQAESDVSRTAAQAVQALLHVVESHVSVTKVQTAKDAMRVIDLLNPDLLVIDPLIPGSLVAANYAKQHAIKVIILGQSAEPQSDTRPRILVVDSTSEVVNRLSTFLLSRGFSVITASSGPQCMEILEQDPFIEVVILDVLLPGKGGLEILATLAQWKRRPGLIVTSPVTDSALAETALRLGAFDILIKPIDVQALEIDITACLARKEYREQGWWKRFVGSSLSV